MTRIPAVKVLTGLIALQLLIAGVAAATVDDGSGTPLATGGATTTTTTASDTENPSGTVEGTGGDPSAGQPQSPGTPPSGEGSPGPAGSPAAGGANLTSLPERPTPPRPGSYRYRNKFDSNVAFGPYTTQVKEDRESSVVFEAAGSAGAETRDRKRETGSAESGGFGASASGTEERSWRADGMYVTSEAAETKDQDQGGGGGGGGGGLNGQCDWQPDIRQLAFPLKVGSSWTWDSKCESKSEDGEYRRRSQGTAKVTGTRTASVGGRDVAVFVIEVKSTEDVFFSTEREGRSFDATTHIEAAGVDLYASSVALLVRTEREFKGTSQSSQAPGQTGRFEGDGFRELLSLDPT